MRIILDRASKTPVYRQIVERVQTMVVTEGVPGGTRLPTVRGLAKDLCVSIPTVMKAYATLRSMGLVTGEVGSGTFVSDPISRSAAIRLFRSLKSRGPLMQYEHVSHRSGLRSMATAAADPDLFQADELVAELHVLAREDPWSFYYTPSEGNLDLIRQFMVLMAAHGLEVREDQVQIGPGTMGSVSSIVSAFARAGDEIVVEDVAFLGAPMFFSRHRLRPLYVPRDGENTPDVQALQTLLKEHRPRLLLLPHGNGSTTGYRLTEAKKAAIAETLMNSDTILIEAGNMSRLSFEGKPGPSISSYIFDSGRAVYFESLDYSLVGGLRTAAIVSSRATMAEIRAHHRAFDLSSSNFLQLALARYLERGGLRNHLLRVIPKYRSRRDAMLSALSSFMDPRIRWTRPDGGFALLMELPPGTETEGLYEEALDQGIAVAPGWMFRKEAEYGRFIRLSYSMLSSEAATEAIRILAWILQRRLPNLVSS